MSFEAAGSGCICVSLFSKERKLALFQKKKKEKKSFEAADGTRHELRTRSLS
jgi:hypothetical protein